MGSLSRLHEKEELQKLNERFSAYVARVRHLGQQPNNVDASVFLRSTKILEEEITNLKNLYENELDKLREEIEAGTVERNALHAHNNKQHKYIGELQDRLGIETDKNSRLLDEVNNLQRRIANLEAEVKDARLAAQRPQEEVDQLQKNLDSLNRELDELKFRYDQEQIARQQTEDRLQQIMKKVEFSDQVHNQQIKEYQNRLDSATASILNLEGQLSSKEASSSEMLKQLREAAEEELRRLQIESEEQYNRNLSTLKAQIDYNDETIQRLSQEKSELTVTIAELQGRIRSLEGQVASLQQQKKTLEDQFTLERSRGAENIRLLEKRLKDMQDMLVTQVQTVTRESKIPLKTEIEALKALLEEEERRLLVPAGSHPASSLHTSKPDMPTAREIINPSLSTLRATTSNLLQPAFGSSYDQNLADRESSSVYQYDVGPPFITSHIPRPQALQSRDNNTLFYDGDYDSGIMDDDMFTNGIPLPMTGPQYFYESSPSLSRVHIDPSPPGTSHAIGPIQSRNNSGSAKPDRELSNISKTDEMKSKHTRWTYTPASFGCGRDYFQEKFSDGQKNLEPRPNIGPGDRQLQSSLSTSSAIGDLKIQEVSQDGKYVRLVNDGSKELEIGGYIIRQNVNGEPVAIFKFPPNVKFPPDSTITVWSAKGGSQVHNPPTDFLWKEKPTWGTGPECSTILCLPHGQAVAWITSAHRYSRGAVGNKSSFNLEPNEGVNQNDEENIRNEESWGNNERSKLGHISLRREKQQPPLLATSNQSYGSSPAANIHQQSKQQQPQNLGHETNNYKKAKTHFPSDDSRTLRTIGKNQLPHPPTIRGNGTLVNKQDGVIITAPCAPYIPALHGQLTNDTRDRVKC